MTEKVEYNIYGCVYILYNQLHFFIPTMQARSIKTSELAAIKIVKLDPGMLTIQT